MTKKDQVQIIITGGLVVILIFAVINGAKTINKAKKRREKQLASPVLTQKQLTPGIAAGSAVRVKGVIKPKKSFNQLEEETRNLGVKRDPFTLRIVSSKSVKGESLSGIIWDEDVPMAIINGKILAVGENIGEKTLVDIKEESVILSDGIETYELKLGD